LGPRQTIDRFSDAKLLLDRQRFHLLDDGVRA
jgi:hypothetical protein